MKETVFTSFTAYEQFLHNKYQEKARAKGLSGSEFHDYVAAYKQDAQRIWEEQDCDQEVAKNGFVTIQVSRDINGNRVVKRKRGRPKKAAAEKRAHPIHVRLDKETNDILLQYKEKHGCDTSEAVRIALRQLKID